MSWSEKIKNALGKIFHKPTITIEKTNILLYITLIMIFIIALLARLMPLFYHDAELHALDPYVQYRTAMYIVNNGFFGFMHWHDTMSWYPYGKDMGASIYPGTPLSGVTMYYFLNFIGIPVSLLEGCVIAPAVLGSLTVIMMYFLGKVVANKKVGILAALFLMVSPGHMQRSYAGFFDNEALGIFLIVSIFTFYVYSLKKGSILSGIMAGICLGALCGSWSSWDYVVSLLALTTFLLLLLNKYSTRLLISYSLTILIGWTIGIIVPRTGTQSLIGSYGIISLTVLGLLLIVEFWKRFRNSKIYFLQKIDRILNWRKILLYSSVALLVFVVITASTGTLQSILTLFVQSDLISGMGNRVLAILNPLYVSQATRSVAEHIPSSWSVYYYNFSFTLLLLPLGIFFLFKRLQEEHIMMILFGITMVYFASSYIRLQLLLAPAIAIIGAYGLASLFRPFSLVFKKKFVIGRRKKRVTEVVSREIAIGMIAFFSWMLLYPTMHGIWNAYANLGKSPGMLDDMKEGYTWMRTVLPSGTVVASWWDYGYRITTMGEKVTVDDNATSNSTQMGMIGRLFMATDESVAIKICKRYNISYVMVRWGFFQNYLGGDEGKWQWMLRIASQTLEGTVYAIDVASIWDEEQYKVTKNFFDTVLWKMLMTGEPYIDDERTYSTTSGQQVSGKEIIQNGGFYRAMWSRITNPDDNDQYKTVEGHDWDYYNPSEMGPKTSLPMGSYTVVDVDTYPGDGSSGDMLKFFDQAFFSKYRLMKVYKVNYEKADLRFNITQVDLYNNSVAYLWIENTGERIFDIDTIEIEGNTPASIIKLEGNGTTDLDNIYPGKSVRIRASEFGSINYNETYNVKVKIKDSSIPSNTYERSVSVVSERVPEYNMTILESSVYLFGNNSIIFSVQNTGEDYLSIDNIDLDGNIGSSFITEDSTTIVAPGEIKRFVVDTTTMEPQPNMTVGIKYSTLKINSDSPSNLSIEFYNLSVVSPIYCAHIVNLTAWANETIEFGIKNNGFYDLILDHIYIDGLIWDSYITPNPHNLQINKNEIQEFRFYTTPDLFNVNDSDIITMNVTVKLPVNQTLDEINCRLYGNYLVENDWSRYNLTIKPVHSYSNETLIVNLTNTGTDDLTISEFKVLKNNTNTWFKTYNFNKTIGGQNTLSAGESALFRIESSLNLNYTDYINISVNTLEGAWANLRDQLSMTEKTGNISISWSLAYQNNDTVYFNITNNGNNNVTVKNIYFNGEAAEEFSPIDNKYKELAISYNTISSGATQMFKAVIKDSQMASIIPGGYLILNATTYEGATDAKQVSWAYNMNYTKIYAFNNDTIKVIVKNIGVGNISINSFYVNNTLCNWTVISGTVFLKPNEFAEFLLNTTADVNNTINLNFSDRVDVKVVANYSSSMENITYTYENLFVLDVDYNITILERYPYTYAFDNGTLNDANDTIYISVMNTGGYGITVKNITINGVLRNFTIVGNTSTDYTIEPYEIIKLVNSTNLGLDLNATEKIKINVTTNSTIGSNYVWDDATIIVCYTTANVTLLYKNNESYVDADTDLIYLNLTNYGNEILVLKTGSIYINNTIDFMERYNVQFGIAEIELRPGDNVLLSIDIHNLGPFISPLPNAGDIVKVTLVWKVEVVYINAI
ncbi:MAG: STT3 domain-containing protein [Candidatus Helarchaeota archaeon]